MADIDEIKARILAIKNSGNKSADIEWSEWEAGYEFDPETADEYDIANANARSKKIVKNYSITEAMEAIFNRDDLQNLEAQLDRFVTAVQTENIHGELLGDASDFLSKLMYVVDQLQDSDIAPFDTIFEKDPEGTLL